MSSFSLQLGDRFTISESLLLANEVIDWWYLRCTAMAASGTHRRFNDARSYVGSWGRKRKSCQEWM
jgi:hypothetical protein